MNALAITFYYRAKFQQVLIFRFLATIEYVVAVVKDCFFIVHVAAEGFLAAHLTTHAQQDKTDKPMSANV